MAKSYRAPLRPSLYLLLAGLAPAQLGERYCSAVPNSTGQPARIGARGSAAVGLDALTLTCEALPGGSVGYFLVSRTAGFAPSPTGLGDLCLSGAIGRYRASVLTAPPSGEVALPIDLAQVPFPTGASATLAGDTLRFQYWYRDTLAGGAATSNLSDGLAVTFHCSERPFPARSHVIAAAPQELELGDLDGDGDLDAVAVCSSNGANAVSVLLGDGLGQFGAEARTTLAGTTGTGSENGASLALADFDGDGALDAAVALPLGQVAFLRGLGDGSFGAPTYLAVAGALRSLRVGDLDGDGDPDLALLRPQDGTLVRLENQVGSFVLAGVLPVGAGPNQLAFGDVDNDGGQDLVVCHSVGGAFSLLVSSVSVHRNAGGGTFTSTTLPGELRGPYVGLALGDVNQDGALDVVVTATNDSELDVYLALGGGAFDAPSAVGLASSATSVLVADLDGDGRLDLVSPSFLGGPISVLRGAAPSSFTLASAPAPPGAVAEAALGDLDGDGVLDLATVNRLSRSVSTLRGLGAGAFETRADYFLGVGVPSFAVGDFDGDGRDDFAAAAPDGDRVEVVRDPSVAASATRESFPTNGRPLAVIALDLGLDGRDDLVHTNVAGEVQALDSTPAGFVPRFLAAPGGTLGVLRGADLDADAAPELCVVRTGTNEVLLLDEAAGGAYVTSLVHVAQGAVRDLLLVDVDGDGRRDLVVGSASAVADRDVVDVRLNLGNGAFGPASTARLGARHFALAAVDLDGDGLPELAASAVGAASNGVVLVLPNRGAGLFGLPIATAVGPRPRGITAADFDGDGRPDVAVSDEARGHVELLRGRGEGLLAPYESYAVSPEAAGLALGDFDGDGRLDVATLAPIAGVSVVVNQCP